MKEFWKKQVATFDECVTNDKYGLYKTFHNIYKEFGIDYPSL